MWEIQIIIYLITNIMDTVIIMLIYSACQATIGLLISIIVGTCISKVFCYNNPFEKVLSIVIGDTFYIQI